MDEDQKSGSLGWVLAPIGVLMAGNGVAALPFTSAAFGLIGMGAALFWLAIVAIRKAGA